MRARRLYLAGPMTGYPEFNHPAFRAATAKLRAAGFDVFSPAEHDIDLGIDIAGRDGTEALTDIGPVSLRRVLGDDLAYITGEADGIALLSGWGASKGARAEVCTGLAIGIPVAPVRAWLSGDIHDLYHANAAVRAVAHGATLDYEAADA